MRYGHATWLILIQLKSILLTISMFESYIVFIYSSRDVCLSWWWITGIPMFVLMMDYRDTHVCLDDGLQGYPCLSWWITGIPMFVLMMDYRDTHVCLDDGLQGYPCLSWWWITGIPMFVLMMDYKDTHVCLDDGLQGYPFPRVKWSDENDPNNMDKLL